MKISKIILSAAWGKNSKPNFEETFAKFEKTLLKYKINFLILILIFDFFMCNLLYDFYLFI